MSTDLPRPKRIRLTTDYLDFQIGLGYPKGTELVRSSWSGQYMLEGTKLGQTCIASISLLEGLYEIIEP